MVVGCTTRAKASSLGQEPRHPDHHAVTLPQTETLWRSSQDNVELMTQKEVLNFGYDAQT